jgi:hypothetical protein
MATISTDDGQIFLDGWHLENKYKAKNNVWWPSVFGQVNMPMFQVFRQKQRRDDSFQLNR